MLDTGSQKSDYLPPKESEQVFQRTSAGHRRCAESGREGTGVQTPGDPPPILTDAYGLTGTDSHRK